MLHIDLVDLPLCLLRVVAEDEDPVAQQLQLRLVRGGEQHRSPAGRHVVEQGKEVFPRLEVERLGRLDQDEEAGMLRCHLAQLLPAPLTDRLRGAG